MAEVERQSSQLAEDLLDLYRGLSRSCSDSCWVGAATSHSRRISTAQVFLDAVRAVHAGTVASVTVPWLLVVARRRLVDHWRHQAGEQRHLEQVGQQPESAVDPWDEQLDVLRTRAALDRLGAHHRAALTLRYVDGLPVSEVAEQLGRGLHATEALLQRARDALRRSYLDGGPDAG